MPLTMDKYLVRTSSTESLSNKRPAEDNIWRKPKRTANPSQGVGQVTFSTSNRFKDLAGDSDCDQSEAAHPVSRHRANAGRIPPIVVEVREDWSHQTITNLILKFTKNFHLQYRRKGKVAIHCYTNDSHRLVTEGLRSENVFFHTFSRKEDRTYKVVIRGIPLETVSLVQEELTLLGFQNATVNKLKSSTLEDKMACPPLLVQLPAGSDIVKFKQTKYLCNCVIKIERFKPNTSLGTQCYRCQYFGHASKNCNLPERCVKCIGTHATKDCPKKERISPAQCCNCKEHHPANFRQCPVRVNYLQRLHQKKQEQGTRVKPAVASESGRSSVPRAQSVGQPRKQPRVFTTTPETQTDETSSAEASSKFDADTTEMLAIFNVIRRIKHEFSSCTNMMDKVILVLTYLGQYV